MDGLCVPPEPVQIAGAVLRLLDEPDLRRRMGEAGRRRLLAEFTHEVFRRNLEGILSEQLHVRDRR